MTKTTTEINERIRKGQSVVVTTEEIIETVKEKGVKKADRFFGGNAWNYTS
jgi:uncharacterized protein (DUF39 family)